MKKNFNVNLIWIILFVGAVLRFYTLGSYGITADELSALQRTEFNSFMEMITGGVLVDFHPPLVQTFMFYYCKLLGTTEFAIRLPFAIAAILSIYFYYLIALKWFNKPVALLSSAAIACNQLLIIYSRLARPYAFGMLFTAAAVLYLTKILIDKNYGIKNVTLYIFFSWCAMNTHYFALIFIGIIGICSLFFITKDNAKVILLSGVSMFVFFIPSISILVHQLDAGGIGAGSGGWLGLPDIDFLIDDLKYLVNNSKYVLFLYLFLLLISMLIFNLQKKSKQTQHLIDDRTSNQSKPSLSKWRIVACILWIAPIVFGYVYSYTKSPILQHSVLTFSTPFFFILLFSFIPPTTPKKIISILLISILIGVSGITIFAKNFYQTNYFGVYKPIAQRTLEWEAEFGKENITHTINIDNAFFIDYYYKQWNKRIDYKIYNLVGRESLQKMVDIVNKSTTEYFSFAWTNIGNQWEIIEIIKSKYPTLIDKKYFFNSEYYLFKKNTNLVHDKDCVFEFNCNFDDRTTMMNANEKTIHDSIGTNNSRAILLDENSEFSPSFEMNASTLYKNENNILNVIASVKKIDTYAETAIVVVFSGKDSVSSWQSISSKIFKTDSVQWHKVYFSLRFPNESRITDIVKIYFWNTSKKKILVDDVIIKTTLGNPIIYGAKNDF